MSNQYFEVEGNAKLNGTLEPQGAKNEALQIISAVLLTEEEVKITNLPDIVDVRKLIDLVKGLGVKVTKHSSSDYTFIADDIDLEYFGSHEYLENAKKIRDL